MKKLFLNIQQAAPPCAFAIRLLIFWLLFFAAFRLWFVLWLRADWGKEAPWPAFWKALPLDLSMAGYILLLPVLIWFVALKMPPKFRAASAKLITGFNIALVVLLVFAFGTNIFIYQEWHTPLNNRALDYFKTPASMLDSMSFVFKIGSVVASTGLIWLWWRLYRWMVGFQVFPIQISTWNFAWAPVLIALLLLVIRGGTGKMPINESAVYYSTDLFNNHAATNTAWHLLHSMIEARSTENHFRAMDDASARQICDELYPTLPPSDATEKWLLEQPGKRPNVVFILMESMTAQVMVELGGVPDVCPNLSRLAKEGILFENCYGSGYRTDQGLISVVGGFPAQPDQSVVLLQDKAAKLPSVSKTLRDAGYTTAFFYGGQLTFANIGVWLRHQKFERIISKQDFSMSQIRQRWGADDELVFEKAIQTLRQLPQPFFANILTLSLHPPYDVPFKSRWNGRSEREQFLNSAAFADHAIGAFFEQASKEPWYDNTLFVLVADHGHQQPGGVRMNDPRARKVPLLFNGPLLAPNWRGRRVLKNGNHHDIPATILTELGCSTKDFGWSKDLLDPRSRDFAYFSNENGLSWIGPNGSGFFQFAKRSWENSTGAGLDSIEQRTARAYLQTLYNDFLGL